MDDCAGVQLREALARVLPTLGARQRAVLMLRFYENLTVAQVAGPKSGVRPKSPASLFI